MLSVYRINWEQGLFRAKPDPADRFVVLLFCCESNYISVLETEYKLQFFYKKLYAKFLRPMNWLGYVSQEYYTIHSDIIDNYINVIVILSLIGCNISIIRREK